MQLKINELSLKVNSVSKAQSATTKLTKKNIQKQTNNNVTDIQELKSDYQLEVTAMSEQVEEQKFIIEQLQADVAALQNQFRKVNEKKVKINNQSENIYQPPPKRHVPSGQPQREYVRPQLMYQQQINFPVG